MTSVSPWTGTLHTKNAIKPQETLPHLGLWQHSNECDHVKGHILDFVIAFFNCNNRNISNSLFMVSSPSYCHFFQNSIYDICFTAWLRWSAWLRWCSLDKLIKLSTSLLFSKKWEPDIGHLHSGLTVSVVFVWKHINMRDTTTALPIQVIAKIRLLTSISSTKPITKRNPSTGKL